ncbi:MAG: YidC/Oxa1 family membrane protein insertase, partial [Candidatus Pacebacteria bacterium]|nr:YidC/Oxa1 family membrane protein insertase [Candidatus Paceibacterota bacterium]
ILLGLYYVFARSGLPVVNSSILYSFVHVPTINMDFLGILDISKTSISMAVVAAVSQYLQLRFSLASQPQPSIAGTDNPAAAMSKQMRYIMPVMIFILAFRFPAAISLYWAIGNIFMLSQELFVRFHHERGKRKAIGLA